MEVFTNYGSFPGHLAMGQYGFASPEMGWNLAHKMRELLTGAIEACPPPQLHPLTLFLTPTPILTRH